MQDEALADLMCGIEELHESRHGYDKAAAYYRGSVPEIFSSLRLRRALAIHDVQFDLNFARTPVNAVADRLEIAAITGADDATNTLISKIWQDNGLDLELPDLHRHACMFGDAYLIVLPVEDAAGATVRVDMFYNSPQTVRIIYSDENPRVKQFAIKKWADGPYNRIELYYPDRIERWTTDGNATGSQAADWMHWLAAVDDSDTLDPESWLIEHDWGEIPVYHYRTDRPYGIPEHYGAYGPQNAINKLQATHMGTVDYQGFPQRYALTESATTDTSDLEPGDWDDAEWPEDANATGVKDIGDDSSLKSGPGEMWLLRGFKAVGQFASAQPAVFWDPITSNIKAMAQITTTPLRMFEPEPYRRSGVSYQAEDDPFTRKVGNRQISFGATHREAFTFALRRLGVPDPAVSVHWAPPATVDDQEGWTTVGEKIKNGVPRKQALVEAGYRPEQVDAWLDAGADDAELQQRVQILAQLATAAQALGAAATLGVVDTAQVSGLLSGALTDLEVLAEAQRHEEADPA